MGAHRGEVLGAGEGAHAPGHLLLDLHHADVALGRVVVEGHPRIDGEAQVVIQAPADAPGQGPVAVEAPISAAETISRREAASTSGSGRVPVSVIAFSASSASMIWIAQHHPSGTAPLLGGGWAVWESTTAISSRNRCALHSACVASRYRA